MLESTLFYKRLKDSKQIGYIQFFLSGVVHFEPFCFPLLLTLRFKLLKFVSKPQTVYFEL